MNEVLFTAEDARKWAEDSLLATTIKAIKEAARGGYRSTRITTKSWHQKEIQDSLEERGFNVKREPGLTDDECELFIDWNP